LAGPEVNPLAKQILYRPSATELDEARAELETFGGRVYAAELDLTSDESVERFAREAAADLGEIDILVNAAGAWGDYLMVGHPDEHWFRMIDVNLHGPYRTIKQVLPGMIERGWGRIVNIGSTASTEGEEHNAAYCAAKHGLLGLSRCVALEGATHGVTCNVVSPGHLNTTAAAFSARKEIAQGGLKSSVEDVLAERAAALIQRRLIEPDEIAATVAFLCTDDARSITMENLRQSGGMRW
jgi:NAD(P)-dependent dehydrogenase (short-subunit alcohol dehydrogenase family)